MSAFELRDFVSNAHKLYDAMLRVQTDIAYPFERPLFQRDAWKRANSVLDFGCGNGCYLERLIRDFPEKHYEAVEIDEQMRAAAISRLKTVPVSAPFDGQLQSTFDAFLFRLVFMHVHDRAPVLELIKRTASPSACIMVVEAEDRHFDVDPMPPRFEEGLATLRRRSVDRAVSSVVEEELRGLGFKLVDRLELVPNSSFQHLQGLIPQYMWLSAALGNVGSPDPLLAEEVLSWLSSTPAYVQFGEVVSFYER